MNDARIMPWWANGVSMWPVLLRDFNFSMIYSECELVEISISEELLVFF